MFFLVPIIFTHFSHHFQPKDATDAAVWHARPGATDATARAAETTRGLSNLRQGPWQGLGIPKVCWWGWNNMNIYEDGRFLDDLEKHDFGGWILGTLPMIQHDSSKRNGIEDDMWNCEQSLIWHDLADLGNRNHDLLNSWKAYLHLVGGLEHFLFSHILGIIIPID